MNQFEDQDPLADEDRRLSALLRGVRAEANPAVWMRARTRLEAGPGAAPARRLDGLLHWLTRPVAMAAAAAVLVVSLGAGVPILSSVVDSPTLENVATTDATSLIESLLECGTAPNSTESPATGSEGPAPGDSGGTS
jgi:hypothetical protein